MTQLFGDFSNLAGELGYLWLVAKDANGGFLDTGNDDIEVITDLETWNLVNYNNGTYMIEYLCEKAATYFVEIYIN